MVSGAVLYVLDQLRNGVTKAWDWDHGRLMLCAIANYEGEWWGQPPSLAARLYRR
jgi:hypothetical protein